MGLFQAVGNPGEFIPVNVGSLTDGTYASATVVVANGAITSVSGGSSGSLTNGTFTLATVTVTGGQISSVVAGAAGTLAQAYNSGSAGPQVMAIDSTRLGVLIRDNATPIGQTLFGVQNSGGTTKFLDVLAGSLTSAYPRAAAATVGSSAVTQVLAANTINATAPSGIALNDLLVVSVIYFMNGSSAAQAITTPAGWVQIRKDNDAANFDGALYYKVATSTEVGAATFAFTIGGASTADYASAEVWRIPAGSYSGTPTLSGFALNGGFVNSVTIGSITPTTSGILLLAAQEVLGGGSLGFTTPTNFVVDNNVNSSGNRNYSGFQSQQLPPGATGSITVAKPSGGTSKMLAHMVFIANAADSASIWSLTHNNAVPLDGGLVLQNTAAATASYQQASPPLQLTGAAWNTTSNASHAVDFLLQSQPATGNPVSSTLQLYSRINAGSWASVFSLTDTGAVTLTQGAAWIASMLTLTGIANTTNLTASTEFIDANFNFARTVTWATGALTTQRSFVIQAPTYAFAAASTLTTAVTLDITGAPIAGTNATFTNQMGIRLGGTYSPAVATNTSLIYINSTFSPSASSPSFAGIHINPTINGTSSGKATGLAVAAKTNTLTGGTINLVDFGTTTTDYYTGYTSRLSVGTDGTAVFNVTTGLITLKAGPVLDFNASGTIIDELSPGDSGTSITINAGQGQGTRTAGGLFSVKNNGTEHFKTAFDGSTTISQRASWSANSFFIATGAANTTNLAAGVELSDVKFNLARTVTWATGALATQRAFVIQAPTYAFAAASTLTTAATFAITGAPIAGSFATISNAYAFWVQGGTSQFDGTIINSAATAITLSNITPSITLSGTNAAFTFTTNKSAGDTGTDFTINSPVTRTAGNLFIISNNSVSQLTLSRAGALTIADALTTTGNVNIGAGNQVVVTSTNAGLFLNGNKNAGDTGNDVSIGSALGTTRTAGNLAQYINANTQKAYVTFAGLLGWISGNTQTTVGAAGTASALPANPTGYLKIDVNGTTQVVPYYAAV